MPEKSDQFWAFVYAAVMVVAFIKGLIYGANK